MRPNPVTEQASSRPTHPFVGYLSVICGVAALASFSLAVYLAETGAGGLGIAVTFASMACVAACAPVALILGIIGLLLKNRRRTFSALGIATVVFVVAVVVLYFSLTANSGALLSSPTSVP
jgi:hypothetical protein